VLNIRYGGWGTDQSIEALQTEGLAYEPDYVILEFTRNDLTDNAYMRDESRRTSKPFYYPLDGAEDSLLRHENSEFLSPATKLESATCEALINANPRTQWIKRIIFQSQVSSRFYAATQLARKADYR